MRHSRHEPSAKTQNRGVANRAILAPLLATGAVLLLVVVLTVLIAGRMRQQSDVIDRQSSAIENLSRRVADMESRQAK